MDLLILGGTSFVGRHAVEAALDRGHAVSVFNRGRTNPGLFGDRVDELHGDRGTGDYASLAGRSWDAVIDVNAYFRRAVREAMDALEERVGHYTFVSTVSVYSEPGQLAEIDDPDTETITGETYGALKVVCEREVTARFGDRSTMVRPGIVAGPHDPTDRFTHWVRAAGAGGEVVVARRDQPVQAVHGRDLGDFLVTVTERGTAGAYDAVGPDERLTLETLVERAAAALGTEVTVREDPGDQSPLTLPVDGGADWLFSVDPSPATGAGLRNRPIEDTVTDTWSWDRSRSRT